MNKYFKEIFAKYNVLIIFFFLTFIAYIFMHNNCHLGLFFDIPSEVLSMIHKCDCSFDKYFILDLAHSRNNYYFLNSLIFNPLIHIFPYKNMLDFISLFSTSYILSHFILLALNFLIAKRTKRFDIAIIALSFFCFFAIPSYIWPIRELTPNILIYFIFLQFFLAKNKQNLLDFTLINILLFYLSESYETTIIFCIIMFFAPLLYGNQKDIPNKMVKAYIGFGSLVISIVIIANLFIMPSEGISLNDALWQWINGSKLTFLHLFKSNLIITSIMGIVTLATCLFYKNRLNKETILFIIPVLYFIYSLLSIKTNFIPNARIELHFYSIALWFVFPIIIGIILIDTKKYPFLKKFKNFYPNLIILSVITGLLNFAWQFHSCVMFNEYVSYLQTLIKNSKNEIVTIPKEDYETKSFLCFDTAYGTTHKTIFLAPEKKINKILVPKNLLQDYDYNERDYYYYEEDIDHVVLQNSRVKTKTKYWDLSHFKHKYIKEDRVE